MLLQLSLSTSSSLISSSVSEDIEFILLWHIVTVPFYWQEQKTEQVIPALLHPHRKLSHGESLEQQQRMIFWMYSGTSWISAETVVGQRISPSLCHPYSDGSRVWGSNFRAFFHMKFAGVLFSNFPGMQHLLVAVNRALALNNSPYLF